MNADAGAAATAAVFTNNNFSIKNDQGSLEGTPSMFFQKGFSNFARIGLGTRRLLGDNLGISYQGGLRWINLKYYGRDSDSEEPRITSFDFAPISLSEANELATTEGGTLDMMVPYGSVFLDRRFFGNYYDNRGLAYAYIGSSFGLVRANSRYGLDIDSFTAGINGEERAKMFSLEAGILFRRGRFAWRLAHEITHIEDMNFINSDGSMAHLNLRPIHAVRMGLVLFFRKP